MFRFTIFVTFFFIDQNYFVLLVFKLKWFNRSSHFCSCLSYYLITLLLSFANFLIKLCTELTTFLQKCEFNRLGTATECTSYKLYKLTFNRFQGKYCLHIGHCLCSFINWIPHNFERWIWTVWMKRHSIMFNAIAVKAKHIYFQVRYRFKLAVNRIFTY